MKYLKAFIFLISFLFTVAAARDLAKAKTSNIAEAKTIGIPGISGTNPIGGFPGVIGGRPYYGGFPGIGSGIPGIGSSFRGIGDFPGGGVGGFQSGNSFPSEGGGGVGVGGGVGIFPGSRGYCQYGCCQYSGYRCLICC